jgi:amino acid adenylation domain-containing protein
VPGNVALVFGDEEVTYGDLNGRANQLAHFLRQRGVGPEVLVGVCLERSLEMVVGLLAILKAGGAYVPIEPDYPPERASYMLTDARIKIVVSESAAKDRFDEWDGEVVSIDDDWDRIGQESSENPSAVGANDNIAYVIYTSGTTGKPKGTLVTHANVLRLFRATEPWFQFSERDVWTLFHSYAFDFSVWEMWGALLYGGKMVIIPYLLSRTPSAFYELLKRERVTVLNQTPSAFWQLQAVALDSGEPGDLSLRLVIFGGEALAVSQLREWYEWHGGAGPRMVNMYGITETTIHVTYRELSVADVTTGGSPLGRALPDLDLYVLDEEMGPAPVGVAGELYVGGSGLSRGYLNHPDLTAARFLPHPYSRQPGARLYRSGDRAKRLANGDVEYLGRLDHQVKLRGFRIELREIESVLT